MVAYLMFNRRQDFCFWPSLAWRPAKGAGPHWLELDFFENIKQGYMLVEPDCRYCFACVGSVGTVLYLRAFRLAIESVLDA